MLLGGVQIPADVLTAWEEGRLVIFTGAGISMDPPSDLPSFPGLAKQVAQMLQSPLDPDSDEWSAQLDTLMDVLDEGDGVDVHQLVQGIVTKMGSSPNANHDALARIAAKFGTRVVTTNYDLHLETTLRAHHDGPLDVFRAPAMPLGDDFEGLVYLHGSAEDDPRRLIVTDRDFSLAYFHSAWAARFLERMFREYVVLFVGYSHSDVVMKYLGLGLGPKSKRYVLTDKPDDSIWRRLHITPLTYPAGQHQVLTTCVTAWADLGAMGLLDHRQRIRDLVSAPSEPTPDELSYLSDSVHRPDRVVFFCDYATAKFWLEWSSGRTPFDRLFDRSAEFDEVTSRLAYWFARHFALADDADQEHEDRRSAEAWRVFARAGGVLSTTTWNAIAQGIVGFDGERPEHVLRWLWVLMEQEHDGCAGDYLDYALEYPEVAKSVHLRLALLGHLMAPRLVPDRSWGTTSLKVSTRGAQYRLDEVWTKRFVPELGVLAADVLPVAEAALVKHLNLEAGLGIRLGFTRRRSAIQRHPQDRYRDPIDAVIDAVRDGAVELWGVDAGFVRRLVSKWLNGDHVLMRRIAIHVAGRDPEATSDDLVRFVLDNGLASAEGVAQEVLHLLGTAAPDADVELVDRLVDSWSPTSDEERVVYASFANLEWLERNKVNNERLAAMLAEVRLKLPEGLQGSPFPGLSSWMEFGDAEGTPPMSVEAFDERVRADPKAAVEFVLSFEERTYPRSGETSREDAAALLRQAVQERAGAGLELWPHTAGHPELRDLVVAGWGHAGPQDDVDAIMSALVETDLVPLLHGVGQFLMVADRSGNARWESSPTAAVFMERVWEATETDEVYDPGRTKDTDWEMRTINSPAGMLMEFWFEMFRRRWAAAGEDWQGMTEEDRAFLERALADRTERGALALTAIGARLHFLDAADSEWCRLRVLPLRDWSEPSVAEPFWWGALSHARWNSRLVAEGMLDGLLETAAHLDVFGTEQVRRWCSILASIAVRAEEPSASAWVADLTVRVGPELRIQWLHAVREELDDLDEPAREATWSGWLKDYWDARLRGQPLVLSHAEAAELAVFACFAPAGSFGDAVELVERSDAGLDSHGAGSHYLTDERIDAYPTESGRYLAHLMTRTPPPFWGDHRLRPQLERLVAKSGDWRALREAALRLGITLP